jgi:hypothetical protein
VQTTSTYSIIGHSIQININAYIGNLTVITCYTHKDTIGKLDAGIYTVDVVLNNYWWDMQGNWIYSGTYYYSDSFTVQCSIIAEITDSTNVLCYGDSSGTATVNAIGGTEPYSYLWNDPMNTTDSIVTSLVANKYYYVTATDSDGCTAIDSVNLTEPDRLIALITDSTNNLCYGDSSGTATVTASGGTEPYSYLWNDPMNTTDSIVTSLVANKYYHVTVTDSNSCTAIDSVNLTEPDRLIALITDSTNNLCYGDSSGTATITAYGGTEPYSYLWDDPMNTTDSIVTSLVANKYYHIIVSDSIGCIAIDSVKLTEPESLVVELTDSTNISCFGCSDGSATIEVFGGTPPFSYQWDDANNTTDYSC